MTSTIYTRSKIFLEKADKTHNKKYDYSKVNYINSRTKVEIICKEHGSFLQTPKQHISGCGCYKCSPTFKGTTESFISKAKDTHNKKYNYSLVDYVNAHTKVEIICPEHGSFIQIPANHLNNRGCSKCNTHNYSRISIEWLNSFKIDIQHAENGGEYNIPKTKYKVDGYDKETNTVYEFHGDVFHGNPDIFKDDEKCHPYNKNITAKELYDNTIQREEEIKSLGYNLVVIWENNYKSLDNIF